MILVLEGPCGSGKSTLAKALCAKLGWPMYRAFRRDPNDHTPGRTAELLRDAGLPLNTWMEDMFAADLLAQVKSNVILDRSLPSGLAYDEATLSSRLSERQRVGIAVEWGSLMRQARAFLVKVEAPPEVCASRNGRHNAYFAEQEMKSIFKWVDHSGVPSMPLLTDGFAVGRCVEAIQQGISWSKV
jgi:thymidylate kinase